MHPAQTLEFFGLKPGETVVEVWPGAGWWTQILAPYLKANKGKLYAATFEAPNPDDPAAAPVVAAYRKMILERPDIYGDITVSTFGARSPALSPPGAADLVLFNNLDSWMAAGLAEKAFHDAFVSLKRGGVLGVVQARSVDPGGPQDPLASNGHVQEAFVKQMASEAGFAFDASSEVNAHPGAETVGGLGAGSEPDRMTLRFVKKTDQPPS
jgi:predicted methyltransferase